MIWSQNYAPLGSLIFSALVASLPVVTLLGLLAFWHVRAQIAAAAGLVVALGVAVFVYQMPVALAGMAALSGAAFGLFPIGWIVLNAMFVYNLSVATGQFAVLQLQIARVSGDRRIQALLIAFSFGAFIEGAAGFGAPVAITGALMIGMGFRPLEAAKLALIGNTAPVAFGSLGTPLTTLADITGLDLMALSAMVGRQLPVFSLIIPFWLVAAQVGWRGMIGVWPACLVTGLSFGIMQYLMSNFHGPWLVDIVSAVAAMAALVLLMKVWRPADETNRQVAEEARDASAWKAWLPWVFLTAFVFCWGLPAVKSGLNGVFNREIEVPQLHKTVERVPPVVPEAELEKAVFKFNALSATGTAAMLAGVLAGPLPGPVAAAHRDTLRRHDLEAARAAADDLAHARAGLCDPLQRRGHDARPRDGVHRRAVPVLLAADRLAGGGADGQRHIIECPLRQSPAGHRQPA